MKASMLGFTGIVAILIIGAFIFFFINQREPQDAMVVSREGELSSFENFNYLFLKNYNESMVFISQKAAYDLGLNGGYPDDSPIWTEGFPSIDTLKENLMERIKENLPYSYTKGEKEVTIQTVTVNIEEQTDYFYLRGNAEIVLYDKNINSGVTVDYEINSYVPSSYFRLMNAGRAIMEDKTTFPDLLLSNAQALVNKLYSLKVSDTRFTDLDFEKRVNGDIVTITITDHCQYPQIRCLSPLNPGETGEKIGILYDYNKLIFKYQMAQTGSADPTFEFGLGINPSYGSAIVTCPSQITCGDDVKEGTEECDGTALDGQTCQSKGFTGGGTLVCTNCNFNTNGCIMSNPVCGDGNLDTGEECDDKNSNNNDACAMCKNAKCGDGYIWTNNEQCDDGNTNNNDACVNCQNARCGDSYIWTGYESCEGSFPSGTTCISLGYTGGTPRCSNCNIFGCTGTTPVTCPDICVNGQEKRNGDGSSGSCVYPSSGIKTCKQSPGTCKNSTSCYDGIWCDQQTARCENCAPPVGSCGNKQCTAGNQCYKEGEVHGTGLPNGVLCQTEQCWCVLVSAYARVVADGFCTMCDNHHWSEPREASCPSTGCTDVLADPFRTDLGYLTSGCQKSNCDWSETCTYS
jgi:cysteine-rich repeat protein